MIRRSMRGKVRDGSVLGSSKLTVSVKPKFKLGNDRVK